MAAVSIAEQNPSTYVRIIREIIEIMILAILPVCSVVSVFNKSTAISCTVVLWGAILLIAYATAHPMDIKKQNKKIYNAPKMYETTSMVTLFSKDMFTG